MANQAYAFETFAPRPKTQVAAPQVRVVRAKTRTKSKSKLRTAGMLLSVLFIAGLIVGVLVTESKVAELQNQMAEQNKLLVEEQALNVYLTYELDSMTNRRNIEQRAVELGLVKMDKSQVTYIHAREENKIEVQPSGFAKFLASIRTGFLNMLDYIMP